MVNRFFIVIFFVLISSIYCIAGERSFETLHLSTQTGLTSNQVTSLKQDHLGYIWVGTSHGLNRIDGHEVYTWNMSQISSQECHITDLRTDKANNCLWVFNKKGLLGCIDLTTFKLIPHPQKDIDSLYTHHHQGTLYMWQYGPLSQCCRTRLNKGVLTTEYFSQEITDICSDEEGGEWLLTKHGLYLNGFNQKLPSSDSITHITTYRNICIALTPREIVAYNHSRRISRRTSFPKTYRHAKSCTDLVTWKDKLLIFTSENIIIYDILNDTFTTSPQGQIKGGYRLPYNGADIYAYDGKGKLLRFGNDEKIQSIQLMPTEIARRANNFPPQIITLNDSTDAISTYGNGLYLLDLKTGKNTHFCKAESHNHIRNDRINTLLTDHTGNLWVAMEHAGLSTLCLFPKKCTTTTNPPTTHITLITVDGEKHLNDNNEMTLSYTHNNVEWHFSCMAYNQMESITYQYYLSNQDSTWQTPSRNHTAIYRGLQPGKYTFHVRASNDGVHWGQETIHSITIGEPWWTQWPAMVIILIISCFIGGFIYMLVLRFIPRNTHQMASDQNTPSHQDTPSDTIITSNPVIPTEIATSTQIESNTTMAPSTSKKRILTTKDQRFIELLDKLMAEHIEDPEFNVEAFAACANFKRTQFYTKVKQVTGISPVELLRKAHMEHAAKLLKNTDLNIDDIRIRCGFSNSTTFYNYFKQHFGQTPRQYRQNCPAE
ncbi:MAG: helix-turn-helix domain-containing protein [Bacteroidaceae bacterium]|nr:helix-turn-helix domain-containing protein [Bacteroidaceae bacterium]